MGERPIIPRVSKPVDVTDKDQFPEIARAIAWAKRQRERKDEPQ